MFSTQETVQTLVVCYILKEQVGRMENRRKGKIKQLTDQLYHIYQAHKLYVWHAVSLEQSVLLNWCGLTDII